MTKIQNRRHADQIATLKNLATRGLPVTVQTTDDRRAMGHATVTDKGFTVTSDTDQATYIRWDELQSVGTYNA